ncbi:MAG: hypothetical protein A2X35_02140 [Elusimicrobia bacterium GWA2_61_42]|nr:MAG: hypothetical protein A2X35_02140 [Elusimicrobia bacterium GWA2_61_42]OGR79855.1 MAG: hypothetical protein A2X38_12155 [Elusimicrobia bacterium GWC2_61_25]
MIDDMADMHFGFPALFLRGRFSGNAWRLLLLFTAGSALVLCPGQAFSEDKAKASVAKALAAIEAKESELSVSPPTPGAGLERGKDAVAFTSRLQAQAGPKDRDQPRNQSSGLVLSARTVFDTKADTIRKRVLLTRPGQEISFASELDKAGKPFGQLVSSSTHGDRQVYYRESEVIVYSQAADAAGYPALKEWIYASAPNAGSAGSVYSWRFSGREGDGVYLNKRPDGAVEVRSSMTVAGVSSPEQRAHVLDVVRRVLGQKGHLGGDEVLTVLAPPVYWTRGGEKKTAAFTVSDGCLLSFQIAEPPAAYPLTIDPTLNYGQWLGSNLYAPVYFRGVAVATAADTNEIYVTGYAPDMNFDESVTFQGTHSGGDEAFVLEIGDGATPTLNWGQWLGGDGDDYPRSIAVAGDEIYVVGCTTSSTGWEGTFQGTHGGAGEDEGFVVEVQDGATPVVNWGQWLGGISDDYIRSVAVNGDEIYVGGYTYSGTSWETVTFQGSRSSLAEGFVVEIQDGATPVLNWGQWLGGTGDDFVYGVAVWGDEVYACGHSYSASSWEGTFQGTHSGGTEGFVVEIQDGATPVLNWGQWLGGTGDDYTGGVAANGDEIYVAGDSFSASSWEGTFQGTHSGGDEGFVVEVGDGATPTLNWGQWLGGSGNDSAYAVAVNGDEIYAAGDSYSATSWEGTFQGAHSGYDEVFVVEIGDGATPTVNWGQWLGGSSDDFARCVAVVGEEIYVAGYSDTASSWEAVTFQGTHNNLMDEGFVVEVQDGATPTLNWGQWLGAANADYLRDVAVNGNEIYVVGYSTSAADWGVTFQGTYSGGLEAFLIEIQDGVTPVLNWGQWLGGVGDDYAYSVAVNGDEIYVAGESYSATGWEVAPQGTFSGGNEGYVAEVQDGALPTVNWVQWVGGSSYDYIRSVAVSGDEIYAYGYANSSLGWEATMQGSRVGYDVFVVEIQDGAPPTVNWGQWIGGDGTDSPAMGPRGVAVSGDEIYVGGYSSDPVGWETVTFQGTHSGLTEGFVIEIQDGATPVLNWGQWLGGTGNDYVYAVAVNGDEIYAGGDSFSATSWERTFQGTFSGGDEGFVIEIQDGASPTLNWAQWLGGTGADYVNSLAVNGDNIYIGGVTDSQTSWESPLFGTVGAREGFVVKLQDGFTPIFKWVQCLGGGGSDYLYGIAIKGDVVYVCGHSYSTTWEPVTFQGIRKGASDGYVIKLTDESNIMMYPNF